jgi:hypothetical protein
MGRGQSEMQGAQGRRGAELPTASTGSPYSATLYHGTTQARARAIMAGGFKANRGVVFLTTSRELARDYSGGAVLSARITLTNPLVLDGSISVMDQLRRLIPDAPDPEGGDLGAHTIDALAELGFDGLVIRYPADARDPSAALSARDVVRLFGGAGQSAAAESVL